MRSAGPGRVTALILAALGAGAWGAAPSPAGLELVSGPELFAPGVVSTAFSEVRLAVSPDQKTALWGSTDRTGGPGGWNVWMSRRGPAGWGVPEAAPFDSDSNDFDPAFSPDGRFVYFFSNRPGGLGGDDIYRVPVAGEGFGPVEHLGPEVNSRGDEWAPAPAPDGGSLLFATNGRGGAGRHDLFVARGTGTGFAAAEPLRGDVNTAADEFDATFLGDGHGLVFSRSKDVDSDPILLYFARSGPEGYDRGQPLPPSVNVADGYTLGPALDWADPSILYFSGKRPEASLGKLDVYRVRVRVLP